MFLDMLADDLAAAGCDVRTQPGWERRSSHSDGLAAVAGVLWHHTASPVSWDPHRDLDYVTFTGPYHPEYHVYISRSGAVHVICAGRATHAGKGGPAHLPSMTVDAGQGNAHLIGVCFASTGTGETYPSVQIEAGLRVAVALSRRYGLDPGCHIAHREWAPGRKIDPAGPWEHDAAGWQSMDRWRALIAAALSTTPPTIPQEDDDMAQPKYELFTPKGFYDSLAVGPGVPFHVKNPSSVQELVDMGKVVDQDGNAVAAGRPYAEVQREISLELWTDIAGFAPSSPR